MHWSTISDFDERRRRWQHFWAGAVYRRPPVWSTVTHPGRRPADFTRRYRWALDADYPSLFAEIDHWLSVTEFLGDSVPLVSADQGPDQFAAWLGTELVFSPGSPTTNWARPVIEDWSALPPLRLDPGGRLFSLALDHARRLAHHGEGRYLVSVADLHSNLDALLALRGGERLCLDLHDVPETIERALVELRRWYAPAYDALFTAGAMGGSRGSGGWLPLWCEGRYATIQCDSLALIGPEHARRFVLPALEEEAAHLDHCAFHLDGPGCLKHLDDILAIPGIDVIQWGPGAGQPPMHEWLDVLRRCQAGGRGLLLSDITDLPTVQLLAAELRPEGLLYVLSGTGREEALRIIDWLEQAT